VADAGRPSLFSGAGHLLPGIEERAYRWSEQPKAIE
jgi:hypothetical protein